jgi:hypothetical protein
MNIARQDVHYLLYLYDSLRLYLNQATIPDRPSHLSPEGGDALGPLPNALILASVYHQPVRNLDVFQRLMISSPT